MKLSEDQVIIMQKHLKLLELYITRRDHTITKEQCKKSLEWIKKKLETVKD
jgi:hypothetical protein